MIKKPLSWILVMYDVPQNPSKLKVRVWRELKKMGALYPQMSLCLLPDNKENQDKVDEVSKIILTEGGVIKVSGAGADETENEKILKLFRKEKDKLYDEIVEECMEFVEEIELNIHNNKLNQEEVEEMEEVLEGLNRWFTKVLSTDWIDESPKIAEIKDLLHKCHNSMERFAELSLPEK
jgi:hypothetical protein